MSDGLSLDRRALLQRVLMLTGATLMPGASEALAATKPTGKRLLDSKRYALLTSVADTMVPKTDTAGAVDVGVPEKFDALLRDWAAPARRQQLIGALDAIDAQARKASGKPFAELSAEQRYEVLTPHDAAALKATVSRPDAVGNPLAKAPSVGDPNYGRLKQEPVQSGARSLTMPAVADPAYAKLKELIVVLYYFSEPALTQELVYEHAPGPWQPSVPVTPQTRASGGAAMI